MSCRTTAVGRFSIDLLKNLYPFTESQAMSIFHKLTREYADSEASEDSIETDYRRALTDLIRQIGNAEGIQESKKQRLFAKLNELRANDNDTKHKYAVGRITRTADLANALINTHISVTHRYQERLSKAQVEQNYKDLLKEFSNNRAVVIANAESVLRPSANIDGIPEDKATRYALGALASGLQCLDCGRFTGLSSIHICPSQPPAGREQAEAQSNDSEPLNRNIINPQIATLQLEPLDTLQLAPSLPIDYNITSSKSEPIIPMSMEEFQDRYDTARRLVLSGEPVPVIGYASEGDVTAGLSSRNGGNTFGIELEVDFPNELPPEDYDYYEEDDEDDEESDYNFNKRHLLAQDIYAEGVSLSPRVQRWHYIADSARPGGEYLDMVNGWICEYDRSVDPYRGNRGVEVKSQILYDEPATWENIRKISEKMQQHGAQPTPRTGMHINIGGAGFDSTNPRAHNRLLRLAEAYDDTLIRLAHNPASGSAHRGRSYCAPASIPPIGYESVSKARAYSNHYQAFNLAHLPSDGEPHKNSSRVEVRFWDAAVDLGRIQSAVAISTALVELAIRDQSPGQEKELAGSHIERFGSTKLEGDIWEASTLSFRNFTSLMELAGLKSEVHKQSLFYLFAESRWNRA
jgi:hypothetical protein